MLTFNKNDPLKDKKNSIILQNSKNLIPNQNSLKQFLKNKKSNSINLKETPKNQSPKIKQNHSNPNSEKSDSLSIDEDNDQYENKEIN